MKTKIMLLLLTTVLMMIAAPVVAQWDPNTFMLNADTAWPSYYCLSSTSPVDNILYLVVENPINPDFESSGSRPVQQINGFECALVDWGNFRVVSVQYPVPSINIGSTSNQVVGYSVPIPVISGGPTILATITFAILPPTKSQLNKRVDAVAGSPLPCETATDGVFFAPTERPSIVGSMAYLDAEDTDDPLIAATTWNGFDQPAFLVEPWTVATENQSWGSIKSLYR